MNFPVGFSSKQLWKRLCRCVGAFSNAYTRVKKVDLKQKWSFVSELFQSGFYRAKEWQFLYQIDLT